MLSSQLIFSTNRLMLVPIRESDIYMIHAILTNESVRRYLFGNRLIMLSETKKIISISRNNFYNRRYGIWLIRHNSTHEIIGLAGLWDFFAEPQPQLLCALLPKFWRRGFAAEATLQVMRYAFEKLGYSYLMASCDVANREAIAVMKRLSMEKHKEKIIADKPLVFYEINKSSEVA